MSPLPRVAALLVYISSLAWAYLYLYPIWHGCGFPEVRLASDLGRPHPQFPFFQHDASRQAPFRLLVLADPQLEGDTSLPDLSWPLSSLELAKLPDTLAQAFKFLRKKLDLWGNDRYLAHIYRSLQTFTYPTHVTVLGDLLGSQWIGDDEFESRADRFWHTVFAGSERVPDFITRQPHTEVLGEDKSWKNRVIAVAGNHDIGYAGDISSERIERFERRFGKANWDVEFQSPGKGLPNGNDHEQPPAIKILVLNSMNLDTPALSESLQTETYAALNGFIARSRSLEDSKNVLTILLTHIPLHKPQDVCVDAPWFDFHHDGGVKAQNLLSDFASKQLLEGIFGMSDSSKGRKGLILTGHDHEGCDVWHYLPPESSTDSQFRWNATRWQQRREIAPELSSTGIREVTLRAMMGEYGGNAVLLSAWFDETQGEWAFGLARCAIGQQHIWWAIHVLFIVTALVAVAGAYEYQSTSIRDAITRRKQKAANAKKTTTEKPRGSEPGKQKRAIKGR